MLWSKEHSTKERKAKEDEKIETSPSISFILRKGLFNRL
jgi:hypothetical protein